MFSNCTSIEAGGGFGVKVEEPGCFEKVRLFEVPFLINLEN